MGHAMIAVHLYVLHVTGVMNIKQITKFESAIGVMLFIAKLVMRWTNVRTAAKLFAQDAVLFAAVNFVDVVSVKIAPLHVEDVASFFVPVM